MIWGTPSYKKPAFEQLPHNNKVHFAWESCKGKPDPDQVVRQVDLYTVSEETGVIHT